MTPQDAYDYSDLVHQHITHVNDYLREARRDRAATTELLAEHTTSDYPPGTECNSRLTTKGRGERGYHTDRTPDIGTHMYFTGDPHTWTVRSTVTSRNGTVTTKA